MTVKIVLANTSHPGNIGAAARAMKTMGLYDLCLVSPQTDIDDTAYARATHAADVLDNSEVVTAMSSAVANATLVIGTSARPRHLDWPVITPKELKDACAGHSEIAIVFGNERTGLSNHEISYCNKLLHIPTNKECQSLNLAAAVQIIAYELSTFKSEVKGNKKNLATHEELEYFFKHLMQIIDKIEFIKATSSKSILLKMKCLFQRAAPNSEEIAILRGILTNIERKL